MAPMPFFSRKFSVDSASSASSGSYSQRNELATLSNTSNTTLPSMDSIPYSGRVTPSAANAVGWGKVVAEGGYLSVHTLGVVNGKDVSAGMILQDTTHRVEQLRQLMKQEPEPLDFYIVPSEDSHQSEFVAAPDKRREFISGFTGSSGVAIITVTEVHLFVDSRYYLQAQRQLGSKWKIHQVGTPGVKDWIQWLGDRPPRSLVGVDSRLLSHESAGTLINTLAQNQSRLKFPRLNLIDVIWKQRPPKPSGPIYIHEEKFAGRTAKEKIESIQAWIKAQKPVQSFATQAKSQSPNGKTSSLANVPTATILSNLSSIAWLLNLRGSDLPYTPVFHAYLFVSLAAAVLFIDRKKLTLEVEAYLKVHNIVTREYADIYTFLRTAGWGAGRVLIDSKTPYVISLMLSSPRYIVANSYGEEHQAIKNETEIAGFRQAYLRDGAAMAKWFAWLEEKMQKNEPVSEWGASQKLTEYKRLNAEFVGLAYENISATGPNAAQPHYTPTRTSALLIDHRTPFLMDSGGQYFDGTCDTTRTVHFGNPTREMCEAYTKVLKGHIALDSVIFPEGTTGAQLDVLARKALWKDGMNYGHGSGHGVGSFLNVHEGPQGFSNDVPLQVGHVLTNEPGVYKKDHWGIRIESAMVVRKADIKNQYVDGTNWLGFERFTQVPIQTKMILPELLTKEERRWVKMHNSQVRQALSPMLQDDKRALRWLKKECTREGPPATHGGIKVEWD